MTTPARRQYLDIKSQHEDAILLYQIGDFFETFDEDARLVARELQIVLTRRSYGPDEVVPLAGVPVHAIDNYAAKLLAKGYRVAICEQVAPPGRGLVRREVTRVLTPGTVVEPALVAAARDNYLVAVAFARHGSGRSRAASIGLAYVEATSGACACTEWPTERAEDEFSDELRRLAPGEVLMADSVRATQLDHAPDTSTVTGWAGETPVTWCPDHYFDEESAHTRLRRHFGVPSLAPFGCERAYLAATAAGAILAYLDRVNPALARLMSGLRYYDTGDFVQIDPRTWHALEALEGAGQTAWHGTTSGRSASLLSILDATRTAMGARLLRRLLLLPLKDRQVLEERLDAVAELHAHAWLRESLAATLDGQGDLERLTGRVVHGTATPRELHALARGLERAAELTAALRSVEAPALQRLRSSLDACPEATQLVCRAVEDPHDMSPRTIRLGYDGELDTLVASTAHARAWIAALEATERERTGIKSLKVGFNKVFGYYLEVTRPNLARIPQDYQRRQTTATGERYVTAELKEQEALVMHAEEQIDARQRTIYADLLGTLAGYQNRLRATAAAFAQADVWLALATVALARGYVRPELTDSTELEIVAGRHPIVEATLDGTEFVANDLSLDDLEPGAGGARLLLLTGPNMAGKSTYLRQVASIVLLAQIGSFVPAGRARIGLVDRIFARVGAQDDLARGLSTFMLEMVETAYILRHATPRSLVVLDEVGRGTSTHDGLALARAVVEYLHDTTAPRTLFATHYTELAALADELAGMRLFRMEVAERDGEAIFVHRVVAGVADQSYGVHVARMAGLPPTVITRAEDLLSERGSVAVALHEQPRGYVAEWPSDEAHHNGHAVSGPRGPEELALAVASLNIAAMTPIEAINALFSLQQHALALTHGERQ
jgi:DNA mismatch repair protein MutS